MTTLSEFSELMAVIYHAALDSSRWPIALERLAGAFGAAQVALSEEDLVARRGVTRAHGADPTFVHSYRDYYMHCTPERSGGRCCGRNHRYRSPEEFHRTEFPNDFLRPQLCGDMSFWL